MEDLIWESLLPTFFFEPPWAIVLWSHLDLCTLRLGTFLSVNTEPQTMKNRETM